MYWPTCQNATLFEITCRGSYAVMRARASFCSLDETQEPPNGLLKFRVCLCSSFIIQCDFIFICVLAQSSRGGCSRRVHKIVYLAVKKGKILVKILLLKIFIANYRHL